MQADEDIGKMALAVPLLVCKLFSQFLVINYVSYRTCSTDVLLLVVMFDTFNGYNLQLKHWNCFCKISVTRHMVLL